MNRYSIIALSAFAALMAGLSSDLPGTGPADGNWMVDGLSRIAGAGMTRAAEAKAPGAASRAR